MNHGLDGDDEFMFEEYIPDEPVKLRPQSSKPQAPRPPSRAPTMIIEAVRVGRPKKVLGFLAGVFALLLFVISTGSTSWMETRGTRVGLFQECLKLDEAFARNAYNPKNPNTKSCQMSSCLSWPLIICGGLNVFGLGLLGISQLLTVYGMKTIKMPRKYITYSMVVVINCLAIAAFFMTLVMFPIFFYSRFYDDEITKHPEHIHGGEVSVGWATIVCALGICVLSLSTVLIAVDRTGDEIVYEERILQDEDEDEEAEE